jgi:glycosyltransferase involved in cell wall biosynthesis
MNSTLASRGQEDAAADRSPIGPLVTIIMCVYNAGEYLRPSLLSVLDQTYRNLDIVIIDDGSTDGCFSTIKDLLGDDRIRVFHQENATRPVALNRALDQARGEFYAIQDGDDISHPLRIEKQLQVFMQSPQLAAVFCGNEIILGEKPMAPTFSAKSELDCKRDVNAFRMPAHDPTGMFRMSAVEGLFYDATMPFVEAFDYIMRVGERHPIKVLGECLYGYRILSTSVTRRDPSRREGFVIAALTRACERRGLVYDRVFPQGIDGPRRSRNSVLDNNIAAHFMRSVLDQRRAGRWWGAVVTGLECVRLHPLDAHYYKALAYALTPSVVVSYFRRGPPKPSVAPQEQVPDC